MDIIDIIKTRRSVREFEGKVVEDNVLEGVLDAGRWAPSGLNNQPWRFVVVRDEKVKNSVSQCTKYSRIVCGSNVLIAVFLDNDASYDRTKDILGVGACIQNMLLCIHSVGLGACWLGEILNQKEEVNKLFDISSDCELMAVIAVGYPEKKNRTSTRHELNKLIIKKFV